MVFHNKELFFICSTKKLNLMIWLLQLFISIQSSFPSLVVWDTS